MNEPTATLIAAIIAAILSGIGAWIANKNHKEALDFQRKSEVRRHADVTLRDFLIPLDGRLQAVKALFSIFRNGKPKDFRTLEYLVSPASFKHADGSPVELSVTDRLLLQQIIEHGTEINRLIYVNRGMISDKKLLHNYNPDPQVTDIRAEDVKEMGLFTLATLHFHFLKEAFAGNLRGNVEEFKSFVYPRELDTAVRDLIAETRRAASGGPMDSA